MLQMYIRSTYHITLYRTGPPWPKSARNYQTCEYWSSSKYLSLFSQMLSVGCISDTMPSHIPCLLSFRILTQCPISPARFSFSRMEPLQCPLSESLPQSLRSAFSNIEQLHICHSLVSWKDVSSTALPKQHVFIGLHCMFRLNSSRPPFPLYECSILREILS